MLRSVLRNRSLVRLRRQPAEALIALGRAAAPCGTIVSSWPAITTTSRVFSVATTDTHPLEVDTVVVEDTEELQKSKKKKSKKKKRKRPTKTKAWKLFDEIAPHLPLKTLTAITRKLKRSAPKIHKRETRIGQVQALLETAKMPTWAQQRFTEFLLKQPFQNKYKNKEDFPVHVNKQSLESHVEILMQARDLSAHRPLLWSLTRRRKQIAGNRKAAASRDDDPATLEQETPSAMTIHQSKSEKIRRQEAEDLVLKLAERLPEKPFRMLMALFTFYVEQTTNPNKPKLRMLFNNLSKCVSTHMHFIAEDVATFFYVDHSLAADPRLIKREKDWKEQQVQFVEDVLQIYDSLETPTPPSRNLLTKNADTLGELDKLRTRPSDGVKVGRDRQKEQAKHGRRRKNVHLVFDAMLLQDEWNAPNEEKHIVFVDNLPIDMEQTELFDLYSRCGPVQSVQIFNQRDELDPGPLTAKKRREQKVKQRISRNKRHGWKRPRTPVYGQITFTSRQGYDNAVDAPLRIFGMVVRKHAMRTILMDDMTTLYLEDIPKGMYSLDIEHKLSQLLHPEIYVCLDVGQHDFAEPSSCEIKFPSFEMALHAYHKLQELDTEGSSLQWMRTPDDAMKYWTREYSFET